MQAYATEQRQLQERLKSSTLKRIALDSIDVYEVIADQLSFRVGRIISATDVSFRFSLADVRCVH
jgi:hypothetical protein